MGDFFTLGTVGIGLILAVLADRVKYEKFCQNHNLYAYGNFFCRCRSYLEVCL